MKLFKITIFTIIFIFLLNLASAASVTLKATPEKNIILPYETAVFTLTFNSNLNGDFELLNTDPFFDLRNIYNEPIKAFRISSSEINDLKVNLVPIADLKPADYKFRFKIYLANNPDISSEEEVFIKVVSERDLINTEVISKSLDTKKENLVQVKLKNNYNVFIDDLKLKLSSQLFNFERELALFKNEERTENFKVNLKENTQSGEYELKLELYKENKLLIEDALTLKVEEVSDLIVSVNEEKRFLTPEKLITLTNNGNSVVTKNIEEKINFFKKLFTKTDPKADEVSKNIYKWYVSLEPNESKVITIKTNYWYLILILIILAILSGVIYLKTIKDLTITKKVLTIKSKEGISELKVLLVIKNKLKRKVDDIRIFDRIPPICKEPEFGVIKPKVQEKKFIWEVKSLNKGEERVFSYNVKAKLPVIGKFLLPTATVRYRRADNKGDRVIYSNKVILFPKH